MNKWLLNDEVTILVLCSECAKKKYDDLFIRKKWDSLDFGRKFSCAHCNHTEVIALRRLK